ncbi:MAG: 3-methyladenine DNA glycosylase [Bacteroidetes bacterium RBG_13_43_22]|nr:MAG: 3-methyladenine DNA glycosylase [Bacteroidetes bacterium RBG_13_43_22]
MTPSKRLKRIFFTRDVLLVAPALVGKIMAIRSESGDIQRYIITETEAYRGAEDRACHASKGKTARTEVMYHEGGKIYVYFVYGMYWMLNFVAGRKNNPQAVLIRGIEGFDGPGKLTKALQIDGSFYGEDLTVSDRIWIEDAGIKPAIKTSPRIGINYAGDPWKHKPWRYYFYPPAPS